MALWRGESVNRGEVCAPNTRLQFWGVSCVYACQTNTGAEITGISGIFAGYRWKDGKEAEQGGSLWQHQLKCVCDAVNRCNEGVNDRSLLRVWRFKKKKVQNSGDSGHYDFWPVAICTNFISFLYHANIMPTFSNARTHAHYFSARK